MALWQVDFYILKSELKTRYNELISFDENEDLLSWKIDQVSKKSFENISKVLKPEENWSKKTLQYGKIDETCIEVFNYKENLCQIFIRLDMRSLSKEVIEEIIKFIKMNNGIIVYQNKCYASDKETLLDIIDSANAKKFCDDPYRFLTSIKKDPLN